MGVGGQRYVPAALLPGKTLYPLCRRLGGLQGRSGPVRKISPTPGFDPLAVQLVASRYTDWAIPDAQKATISFVMSVSPSVSLPARMEQLDSHLLIVMKCDCWLVFENLSRKLSFSKTWQE